jgi:hypothetical protein
LIPDALKDTDYPVPSKRQDYGSVTPTPFYNLDLDKSPPFIRWAIWNIHVYEVRS